MRDRNICRVGMVFVLSVCLQGAVGGQERERSPEGPEEWIEALASGEFDVREQAQKRLLEAGENAKSALLRAVSDETLDPEVRHRSREILKRLGFATDAEAIEIQALLEELRRTRDRFEWKRLLDRLDLHGPAAVNALQEVFRAPHSAKAQWSVTDSVRSEAGVQGIRVELKNTGREGFWITPKGLRLREQLRPHVLWERLPRLARMGIRAYRLKKGEPYPSLFSSFKEVLEEYPPYLYVEPGESFSVTHFPNTGMPGKGWVEVVYRPFRWDSLGHSELEKNVSVTVPDLGSEKTRNGIELLPPVLSKPLESEFLFSAVPVAGGRETNGKMSVDLEWTYQGNREVYLPDYAHGDRAGLVYFWLDGEGNWVAGGEVDPEKFRLSPENRSPVMEKGKRMNATVQIPLPRKGSASMLVMGVYREPDIYTTNVRDLVVGAKKTPRYMQQIIERMEKFIGMNSWHWWEGVMYSNALMLEKEGEDGKAFRLRRYGTEQEN